MGEDYRQDGDEEAEDWDWEEVDVLVPWVWTSRDLANNNEDEEDLICGRAEDEVGECVLDHSVLTLGGAVQF